MYDLSTRAGVLRFCESKRAEMVRCFERVGRFEENGASFCAYLIATHEMVPPKGKKPQSPDDWKTGAKFPAPKAVLCSMPKHPALALLEIIDPNGVKDAYAKTLRLQGKIQRAIGYVFMNESWFMKMSPPEGHPDPRGAAYEERAKLPESLEFAPGRGEVLMMSVEHQATGRMWWTAEILREPTRVLEWEERPYNDAEGRFVDLTEWRS